MKEYKNTIKVVAIYSGIGEIDIVRGYQAPRTYKFSTKRAALLRSTIMFRYFYSCFETIAFEKFRITSSKGDIYH